MQIAQARGYVQDSSESNLRPLVRAFVAENQDRVEQIRKGKTGLVGWFVGELRRKSGSKGDPVVIKRLVEEEIGVRANKA